MSHSLFPVFIFLSLSMATVAENSLFKERKRFSQQNVDFLHDKHCMLFKDNKVHNHNTLRQEC